jgi:aspartokinase
MTADPRLVPDARVIPSLSYAEVSELAYIVQK